MGDGGGGEQLDEEEIMRAKTKLKLASVLGLLKYSAWFCRGSVCLVGKVHETPTSLCVN